MLERPCTSLKTLHATCYTRARQSRLNGSVSAEPSTRDGVRTRPHSFNAAAAGNVLGRFIEFRPATPHSVALAAGNDAPLIAERAAPRGRIAREVARSAPV